MKIQFGSVWKVSEDVWKKVITQYDQSSTRKSHPGITLFRGKKQLPPEQRIPTLIGVTVPLNCKEPLTLQLGDPEKSRDYKTYLTGAVGPIPAGLFGSKYARQHPGGGRLSAEDREKLEQWCRKRHLIR